MCQENETGPDCPDCHVPCVWSKTVRNEEKCPQCGIVSLHFTSGFGAILPAIDAAIEEKRLTLE